jgi:predicted RecB family endonuclease
MGRAVAEALHGRAPLVVADRDLGPVSDLAARLGVDVVAVAADVTDDA